MKVVCAFDLDFALHADHDAVADRQTQVALKRETALALAFEIVEYAVAVENRFDVFEIDAHAVVGGRDEELAVVAADRETYGAVVGRMLEGIGQQCVEDRRKSVAVGRPHEVALDVQLAVDAVLLRIFAEGLDHARCFRFRRSAPCGCRGTRGACRSGRGASRRSAVWSARI